MKTIALSILLLFAGLEYSFAKNIQQVQETWNFFIQECGLALRNPDAYRQGQEGANGKIKFQMSPDQNALGINKTVGSRYIEVFSYLVSSKRHTTCSAYLEGVVTNAGSVTEQFQEWITANSSLNMTGGTTNLYGSGLEQYAIAVSYTHLTLPPTPYV